MTTQAQLRSRYAREAVTTASPAQLVVMLYDRLLRDLNDAEKGLGAHDIQASHGALMHAQDIVNELNSTLDTSSWKQGEALRRLYDYLIEQLMAANLEKSVQYVQNAREVVEPIRDAWSQIASGKVTGEK